MKSSYTPLNIYLVTARVQSQTGLKRWKMSLFHDLWPMNHYRSSYTSHAAAKKTFARIHLCKSGYVVMKPGSECEHIHTNLDGYMSCQRNNPVFREVMGDAAVMH